MSDFPRILIRPPLRCFHRAPGPAPAYCGRRAVAVEVGGAWGGMAFRCAEHASTAALPLPPTVVFRRVRLMTQIDLAGVAWRRELAETEAAARVERAIVAVDGLVGGVQITSAIVEHTAPAPSL